MGSVETGLICPVERRNGLSLYVFMVKLNVVTHEYTEDPAFPLPDRTPNLQELRTFVLNPKAP